MGNRISWLHCAAAALLATTMSCSSSNNSDAAAPSPRNVHLTYTGPDPYSVVPKTTIEADGVADPTKHTARMKLRVASVDGVTEIYVDDALYVQLPGENNAQQYEKIDFAGLTPTILTPTGFQPASLLDGASAVAALLALAGSDLPESHDRINVDPKAGPPAARALAIAIGAHQKMTLERSVTDGKLTKVVVATTVKGKPARVTMTLADTDTATTITPPPDEQVLRPGPAAP